RTSRCGTRGRPEWPRSVAALAAVDDGGHEAGLGGDVAAEAIAAGVGREVALAALQVGGADGHARGVEVAGGGRRDLVGHDAELESASAGLGVAALEALID